MNTYEITFTRENGSTGKDRITAANEKQARKDFREIYRHSSATITDVIVAAENVPASKQQERDALDQIRAIVDALGPDSYLYDGSMTLADREKMQQAREAFEKLADALREIAAKLAEALKPVINAALSALKKLWKVSAKAIGVPPKWLHLAAHAKKARTRKKYRNRIRRYVFEALAAEGGGGP